MEKKKKPVRRCVRIDVGYDLKTGKRLRKAFYGKTLKEARGKAEEYKAAQRAGMDIASAKNTLAAWIDTWLDIYGQRAGYKQNESVMTDARRLADALGHMPMESIRPAHLQPFADKHAGMSKSFVDKLRGTTNRIFKDAVMNRIIQFNPADGIRWQHAGAGTHRMLEKWEIAHISTNWNAHRAGRWAMLMLYAGLRRGEALALRWEDIDWEHNIIHVRRALHFEGGNPVLGTTKTECSVRDVPMFPVLRRCLQIHDANEEYVCLSAGGKLVTDSVWHSSWNTFNNAMENILNGEPAIRPGRRSDLDKADRKKFCVRAHDLRHTFCSLLYDAGVDVLTAQKMMGHSNPEITMRIYTHLSEEKRENDIEKATAYLERLTAGF